MFRNRRPLPDRLLALGLCLAVLALPVQRALADEPTPPPATTDTPAPAAPPATDTPPLGGDVAPPPENLPSGTTTPVPPPAPPEPPPATQAPPPVEVAPATVAAPPALPKTEVSYRRPRVGLLAAGLAMFAVGWVADIGFTYGYDHSPASTSLIPIAGPFIQLTEKYGLDGPAIDTGSPDADKRARQTLDQADTVIRDLAYTGAVICGALQIAGLVLTVVGAVTKRRVTRYADGPAPMRPIDHFMATSGGIGVRF